MSKFNSSDMQFRNNGLVTEVTDRGGTLIGINTSWEFGVKHHDPNGNLIGFTDNDGNPFDVSGSPIYED